jgi:hypothetical protein
MTVDRIRISSGKFSKKHFVGKAIFLSGRFGKIKVSHDMLHRAIISGHEHGPKRRFSTLTITDSRRGGD